MTATKLTDKKADFLLDARERERERERRGWSRGCESCDLLVEAVEVEDADLAEKVARFHRRQHFARFAAKPIAKSKSVHRFMRRRPQRIVRGFQQGETSTR